MSLLLLAACNSVWLEGELGEWTTLVAQIPSNGSGNLEAVVRPPRDATSMLVTIHPLDDGMSSHLRLLDVDGSVEYRATDETSDSNPYSRSGAAFVSRATTMNWPLRAGDPLLPNRPHTFLAGLVDESRAYRRGDAEVTVMLKADPDPTSGVLSIDLVYAGGTFEDPDLQEAMGPAIEHWRDLYAGIGLQLDITTSTTPEGQLAAPGLGDGDTYLDIARGNRFGAIKVVLLETLGDGEGLLGFAGSIPGPLVSTELSAVAIDTTIAAGTNGRFDDDEIRMFAETLAHEVGHYIGLYHPVEATLDTWDSLDDTPECTTRDECETVLGTNLMYPYVICTSGDCPGQGELTREQGEVANLHTHVL